MARVIEATTDTTWADDIVNLATSIAATERCNAAAVAAGRLELTAPTLDAVAAHMGDPDSRVIISHDGPTLEAYLVVRRDTKLGGCQGRWVGMFGVPAAQRAGVYIGMLDLAVAVFGWVWGRITNPTIRGFLDANIAEGAIAPEDPEVITYKRPG